MGTVSGAIVPNLTCSPEIAKLLFINLSEEQSNAYSQSWIAHLYRLGNGVDKAPSKPCLWLI